MIFPFCLFPGTFTRETVSSSPCFWKRPQVISSYKSIPPLIIKRFRNMSVSSPHSQTSVFTLEEKEACSQITVQHLFRKCWVWFPSSDFLTSSPPYSPSLWILTLGTHGISLIYRYEIAQKQTPQKPGTCLLMCDVGGGGAGSKEFSAELVGYVLVFVA